MAMLSAAGARNMQARVRNGAKRDYSSVSRGRRRVSDSKEDAKDDKENRRRSASVGSSKHRRSHSHGRSHHADSDDKTTRTGRTSRRSERRVRSKSSATDKKKVKFQDVIDTHKKRLGVKSGSSKRETASDAVLATKPTIRLRSVSAKPLPNRSLFQHKKKSWFWSKKKDTITSEDWRNGYRK